MKTTIQTLRKHLRKGAQIDAGFDTDSRGNKTPVFYTDSVAFYGESFAHEVMQLGRNHHTGWYTNPHGETSKDGYGLCRGVVVQFPARPGFPDGWFIAGYNMDGNMTTYFPDVFDSPEDAARFADGKAEYVAECEREYQEKWEKARELEEKNETRFSRLRECLALRNNPCFSRMRDEARELIEQIKETRETLQNEFADYA